MTLEKLKWELETNDISFRYKQKEYVICPLDKFYTGEAGVDDDNNSFDTFEEMADHWMIEGKVLRDIVGEIELF